MELYRNKYLRGVWRLPMFITLAEGNGYDNNAPTVSTQCTERKYTPTVTPMTSPVVRPLATRAPGRMQPSLPPASNYPQHNRECQLHDMHNGQHPQRHLSEVTLI